MKKSPLKIRKATAAAKDALAQVQNTYDLTFTELVTVLAETQLAFAQMKARQEKVAAEARKPSGNGYAISA